MITKDQFLTVIKKKTNKTERQNKEEAKRTIERCSKEILSGNFTVHPVPVSNDIFTIVKKAFQKEGILVKKEDFEVRSKHKTKMYTKRQSRYVFSIEE